jgi:uncharacterized membrane protein YkvA (DUF1232 family)
VKNSFFQSALRQAAHLAGKPGRIARLLTELAVKVSQVDWSVEGRLKLKQQVLLAGRLLKANISGTYTLKSKRMLVGLLAACIYFINPFDLIPDFLVAIGLVDDMALLAWVFNAAASELHTFENWEKNASDIQ